MTTFAFPRLLSYARKYERQATFTYSCQGLEFRRNQTSAFLHKSTYRRPRREVTMKLSEARTDKYYRFMTALRAAALQFHGNRAFDLNIEMAAHDRQSDVVSDDLQARVVIVEARIRPVGRPA